MKRLIGFPLQDGTEVVVEVDEALASGVERSSRPGEVAEMAQLTLETALERIKPGLIVVIGQFRSLTAPPDELVLEFGIKLHAKIGAIIASADAEATYKVSLKWKAGA